MLLSARYTNKQACFTTVYIISNIPLDEQYKSIQYEHFGTFKAFLRRIKHVWHMLEDGTIQEQIIDGGMIYDTDKKFTRL